MTVLSTLQVSKSNKEVMDRKKAEEKSEEDGKLKDKDQYRKFEVPLKLNDTDSDCYAVDVRVFRNGTPEEYCAMRESVETLAERMGYKKDIPEDRSSVTSQQLSDAAKLTTPCMQVFLKARPGLISRIPWARRGM